MSTGIQWTDETWNPMTGCTKVSEGCRNCYAERDAKRFQHNTQPKIAAKYRNGFRPTFHPDVLAKPLHWTKPRRVFVCSMSDLFHEAFGFEEIAAVFGVMAACPQHQFQVLTKRPDRMKGWFEWLVQQAERALTVFPDDSPEWRIHHLLRAANLRAGNSEIATHRRLDAAGNDTPWPLQNVWVGVTVENQAAADERIPLLLETPAAVRFLSCEPLIGPLDIPQDAVYRYKSVVSGLRYTHPGAAGDHDVLPGIDWVIAGGESGPKARPSHPDWFRTLRDQCQAAGVSFFFKQWGRWVPDFDSKTFKDGRRSFRWGDFIMHSVGKKKAGRELDGRTWDEYPEGGVR
ncbi:phage Gp37/Gp68 family protein [bacterium]|nr:phage Gp37/Gp68 family protein [bacterium]